MARENWVKHLTVDKRIVSLLSASTYENFPGAIREMVSNAYDADATEVNINIDLKKDYDPQILLNYLYKHSQMQTTFSINMLSLVEGRPRVLNLKEMIQYFINQ